MGFGGISVHDLIILALVATLYFLPAIVAGTRHHHQFLAIFVLNLLAGWTVLFWMIALVWAFTAVRREQHT